MFFKFKTNPLDFENESKKHCDSTLKRNMMGNIFALSDTTDDRCRQTYVKDNDNSSYLHHLNNYEPW